MKKTILVSISGLFLGSSLLIANPTGDKNSAEYSKGYTDGCKAIRTNNKRAIDKNLLSNLDYKLGVKDAKILCTMNDERS